jgi:hypothetical protein
VLPFELLRLWPSESNVLMLAISTICSHLPEIGRDESGRVGPAAR